MSRDSATAVVELQDVSIPRMAPPINEWKKLCTFVFLNGMGHQQSNAVNTGSWIHIVGNDKQKFGSFIDALTKFIQTYYVDSYIKKFERPQIKEDNRYGGLPWCRVFPATYAILAANSVEEKGQLPPQSQLGTYPHGANPFSSK